MSRERSRLCRMFQNAAPFVYCIDCRAEASAIVPWSIVFAPPSGVIHVSEVSPSLARRVSYHGVRPGILAGVSTFVPCVHVRDAEVSASGLHVERGDGLAEKRRR